MLPVRVEDSTIHWTCKVGFYISSGTKLTLGQMLLWSYLIKPKSKNQNNQTTSNLNTSRQKIQEYA